MDLDKSLLDCPQFADFSSNAPKNTGDSWFLKKNQEPYDAFLRTVDLNSVGNIRQAHQPQRKVGQGSYTECPSSSEGKKRKSHPMRTRQDDRHVGDENDAESEEEATEEAPAMLKPSRQPVAAAPAPSRRAKVPPPPPPPEREANDRTVAKFESMSEKVIKFFHKTPSRFKKKLEPREKPAAAQPPRSTRPVTPQFETDKRLRGAPHVKSAAEREEEEVREMKAAQFRANPMRSGRPLGRSASVNQDDLRSRSRSAIARTFDRLARPKETVAEAPCEPPKPSKAGCKRGGLGFTVAQSPQLQTKKRAVEHPPASSSGEALRASSSSSSSRPESNYHPAPHFKRAFQPRLVHKHTAPQPFSFHERELQRQAEKEQRLKEKAEEALPSFKAQIMPSSSPDVLPPKRTRPVTRTQSFEFRSEARGNAYWEKFQRDREESEENRQQRAQFRAKSPEILRKQAFEPKVPSRFVEPDAAPSLATASRAEERQKFDSAMTEKEREAEADLARQAAAMTAREEAAAANQRREAVHRACPVRHFKPVELQPSSKPPTVARSPKFSKRFNK